MSAGEAGVTTVFVEDKPTKKQLKRSKLTVIEGPDKGKELTLEKERITVGRSVTCDLVLTDRAVSGSHFETVASEKGFLLRDLESTNGTFSGPIGIKEIWIKPGTVFRAGQTLLRFEEAEGHVDIELSAEDRFGELVGQSVRMREVFATLEKIAPSNLTVLIRGETGTGKELVARAIHGASDRSDKPMVVQDCGTIPKDLIESTLFGHERGAFTGATDRHKGSFEQADGGTIFLDEIGELDLALQPKLLRVLESREIKRVGGTRTMPVNVRVVAATNRDLRQMVNEGTFREDLYYRLGVVTLELPALQERKEDIPLIVEELLKQTAERYFPENHEPFQATPEAMSRLQSYPWPGNIRELRNTIERAVSLASSPLLSVTDLAPTMHKELKPAAKRGNASHFVEEGVPFKTAKQDVIEEFEHEYLKVLLEKHNGNITRSAKAAGLTRYHLRELAKRLGIH